MNKTEKRKLITKLFLEYVTKEFPEWSISDDESDGTMNLSPSWGNGGDDDICYHRSRHDLCTYNWCNLKTKAVEGFMWLELTNIVKRVAAME